MKLERKKER